MATYNLFRKDIPPACAYCELGVTASDGTMVDCRRSGLVSPHFHCVRFRYSPIRREPEPPRAAKGEAVRTELTKDVRDLLSSRD